MKIFIYKLTITIISLFILFEFTFGAMLKKFEREFNSLTNKERISYYGNLLREELKKANLKENILSVDDAKLLKKFLSKLSNELNN